MLPFEIDCSVCKLLNCYVYLVICHVRKDLSVRVILFFLALTKVIVQAVLGQR